MTIAFAKATKRQAKARITIIGPSGSGKTYTGLKIGSALGNRVAVIDTERGSASKYADEFEFDVLELDNFDPRLYIQAIRAAEAEGYDVLIIDSLSHAWAGKGGVLELHGKVTDRDKGANSWAAWRHVTPLHNELVDTILQSKMHVIATMRAKTAYVQTQDDRGKTIIKKVGMEAIQRDGMEYEFDIVAEMDIDHNFIVTKTRCRVLDAAVINCPGEDVAAVIRDWLSDGAPEAPKQASASNVVTMPIPETRPQQISGPAPETNGRSNGATKERPASNTKTAPAKDPAKAEVYKLRQEFGWSWDQLSEFSSDILGREIKRVVQDVRDGEWGEILRAMEAAKSQSTTPGDHSDGWGDGGELPKDEDLPF